VGCYPARIWNRRYLTGVEPDCGSKFTVPTALAPSKYVCTDYTVTWSVRRLGRIMSSFTSSIKICELTDIRWVAVKNRLNPIEIHGFSIATPGILVGSHIWKLEEKEHVKLHILCTNHVTIRSELKCFTGAKGVTLKCPVFGGKTGPIAKVQVFVW
jgi:hypothetical protein